MRRRPLPTARDRSSPPVAQTRLRTSPARRRPVGVHGRRARTSACSARIRLSRTRPPSIDSRRSPSAWRARAGIARSASARMPSAIRRATVRPRRRAPLRAAGVRPERRAERQGIARPERELGLGPDETGKEEWIQRLTRDAASAFQSARRVSEFPLPDLEGRRERIQQDQRDQSAVRSSASSNLWQPLPTGRGRTAPDPPT